MRIKTEVIFIQTAYTFSGTPRINEIMKNGFVKNPYLLFSYVQNFILIMQLSI